MRASFRSALLAASLLLASCSDDPVRNSSPSSVEFSNVSLEYYGTDIFSISGRSATDFFVSGNIFAHFDGDEWKPMELPRNYDAFGAIWFGSNGDLYGFDYGNTVYRYSGNEWDWFYAPSYASNYCVAGDILCANNDYGHVWKFSETAFTEIDSLPPLPNSPFFNSYTALAGDSEDNLFATTMDGSIVGYDGSAWTTVRPADGRRIDSAWKEPNGPLYFTSHDSLFTFNGSNASHVDLGDFRVWRVFGNTPAELYVEGSSGFSCRAIRKRVDTSWQLLTCGSDFRRYAVWGADTGESFVGTRTSLLRFRENRRDVLLGIDGAQLDYDGFFYDMWGAPDIGVIAVGARALRFFDNEWTDLHKETITLVPALAVHGTGLDDIWAVGERMILHYDGSKWTWVSGANQQEMRGVWSSEREVIAVGTRGTILRERGDGWETMPTGTTYNLYAVWGWANGAFAAGQGGVILRYNGQSWRIEDSPINWTILDMFGLASNDVWAVGASALEICHFDGREWIPQDIPPLSGDCVSVWASSARNVFVANGFGRIMHFDGNEWSLLPRYSRQTNCLWGDYQNGVLVGGDAILRFRH